MNRLQFGPLALMDHEVGKNQVNHNDLMDRIAGPGGQENRTSAASLPRFGNEKQKSTFSAPSPLACRFFIPQGYEKNYSYPLIVYLHDRLQNENRIDRVMPAISTQNYVGVSVAAPTSSFEDDAWSQNEGTIESARCGVLEAIDSAKRRFNINDRNVFLIGCGSGGTMAFRIANSDPEKFAGVASLNGSFPMNHRPLSKIKSARNLDIFWAHFKSSDRFTEDELCSRMSLLHTAGFDITVRQYPLDDKNDLCPTVFRDVNRWAMGLVNKY